MKNFWEKEYIKKGIPSSFRSTPSGSVLYFWKWLKKKNVHSGTALDLGCGLGRNSIFLAENGFESHCIDFVQTNIDYLKKYKQERQLSIFPTCQSVTNPLPFPDNTFDIVIDIFCYKHQTSKEIQKQYRQEINRVLKKNGHLLITLSGDDDGYYGPLLADSKDIENKLIVDPQAQVKSYLYNQHELQTEFSDYFSPVHFLNKRKEGLMHGKKYLRSTLMYIFQKKEIHNA